MTRKHQGRKVVGLKNIYLSISPDAAPLPEGFSDEDFARGIWDRGAAENDPRMKEVDRFFKKALAEEG